MASVQDIKNQVTTRLKEITAEIAALEKERTQLAKVSDTLSGAPVASARNGRRRTTRRRRATSTRAASASAAPATSTSRGRATRSTSATGTRRRATRRRSASAGGGRADQTVQIIGRRPGITVKEIAAELGIKPNYLYRVLPALEKEGKVTKRGTGYVPAGSSS